MGVLNKAVMCCTRSRISCDWPNSAIEPTCPGHRTGRRPRWSVHRLLGRGQDGHWRLGPPSPNSRPMSTIHCWWRGGGLPRCATTGESVQGISPRGNVAVCVAALEPAVGLAIRSGRGHLLPMTAGSGASVAGHTGRRHRAPYCQRRCSAPRALAECRRGCAKRGRTRAWRAAPRCATAGASHRRHLESGPPTDGAAA